MLVSVFELLAGAGTGAGDAATGVWETGGRFAEGAGGTEFTAFKVNCRSPVSRS